MRTYKLHLIRHGETEGNIKGQYIGVTDLPVTTDGINELRELRETGIYPSVDTVYISPMLRCRQTAEIIYPGLDYLVIDELRECDFGDFEGKTGAEIENTEEFKAWIAGKAAPPNGEDTIEFAKRISFGINRVVRSMMERHEYEASVVMHGGAIMMLFAACALPRKQLFEWTVKNGKGYTVTITPSLYHSSGIIEVTDTIGE